MLREAKKDQSELGKKVANIMARGELVTDEIVIGLIEKKITNEKNYKGFIFDGFPRTLAQADALGGLLETVGQKLDHVVELYVDDEKLVQRIIGRLRVQLVRIISQNYQASKKPKYVICR